MRRTARRYSLCADDADEALQRALEILLSKAPSTDPRELVKWTQTVVKHEALAVRSERERILAGPPPPPGEGRRLGRPAPRRSDGPAEQAERQEAIARSREALQALKPQELRALTLLAEGYSYAEIGEITGWSPDEDQPLPGRGAGAIPQPALPQRGRQPLRGAAAAALRLLRRGGRARGGRRAARAPAGLHPLPGDAARLPRRPGGRRGAGADSAAYIARCWNAPTMLSRGTRRALRRRRAAASSSHAAGGGGGIGAVAVAKVAAVCVGTAGGAAACVAAGLVPAPLGARS